MHIIVIFRLKVLGPQNKLKVHSQNCNVQAQSRSTELQYSSLMQVHRTEIGLFQLKVGPHNCNIPTQWSIQANLNVTYKSAYLPDLGRRGRVINSRHWAWIVFDFWFESLGTGKHPTPPFFVQSQGGWVQCLVVLRMRMRRKTEAP